MSLRLCGIVDHHLTGDELARLPEILAPAEPAARELERAYWMNDSPVTEPWRWCSFQNKFPPGSTESGLWISSSGSIRPGKACILFFTIAKWNFARTHPNCLIAGYQYVRAAASIFNSRQLIMCHDDADRVAEWARENSIDELTSALLERDWTRVASVDEFAVSPDPERWPERLRNMFFLEALGAGANKERVSS